MIPVAGRIYRFARRRPGDEECFILLVSSRLKEKMDCEPETGWTTLTTFVDGRVVLAESWMLHRAMKENPEWFERVT